MLHHLWVAAIALLLLACTPAASSKHTDKAATMCDLSHFHPLTYPVHQQNLSAEDEHFKILPPQPLFQRAQQSLQQGLTSFSWAVVLNLRDAGSLLRDSSYETARHSQRIRQMRTSLDQSAALQPVRFDAQIIHSINHWTAFAQVYLGGLQIKNVTELFAKQHVVLRLERQRIILSVRGLGIQHCGLQAFGGESALPTDYSSLDSVPAYHDQFLETITAEAHIVGVEFLLQKADRAALRLQNQIEVFASRWTRVSPTSTSDDLRIWYASFQDIEDAWVRLQKYLEELSSLVEAMRYLDIGEPPELSIDMNRDLSTEAHRWLANFWETAYLDVNPLASSFWASRDDATISLWSIGDGSNPLEWPVWRQWYLVDSAPHDGSWRGSWSEWLWFRSMVFALGAVMLGSVLWRSWDEGADFLVDTLDFLLDTIFGPETPDAVPMRRRILHRYILVRRRITAG